MSDPYSREVATTSPAGDEVQLVAEHVGATVAQLERRIQARFGERGLTKAARDLHALVQQVETEAGQSHIRLRRTTLAARTTSITIVIATVIALALTLRGAVIEGLDRTVDWVPLVESVINDLVFSAIAMLFLWAFPERFERAHAAAPAAPAPVAGPRHRHAPALQGPRAGQPDLHPHARRA